MGRRSGNGQTETRLVLRPAALSPLEPQGTGREAAGGVSPGKNGGERTEHEGVRLQTPARDGDKMQRHEGQNNLFLHMPLSSVSGWRPPPFFFS
jgi:hypothetical protein